MNWEQILTTLLTSIPNALDRVINAVLSAVYTYGVLLSSAAMACFIISVISIILGINMVRKALFSDSESLFFGGLSLLALGVAFAIGFFSIVFDVRTWLALLNPEAYLAWKFLF